jgi:hypothetical protein
MVVLGVQVVVYGGMEDGGGGVEGERRRRREWLWLVWRETDTCKLQLQISRANLQLICRTADRLNMWVQIRANLP